MKTQIPENWFTDKAVALAEKREEARGKRRLTYDCLNAIVKGQKVVCRKGYQFKTIGKNEKGTLPLTIVLTGRSSSVCQTCPDYNPELTQRYNPWVCRPT